MMPIEDFWLRLYGLSAELHPISEEKWNDTLVKLLTEYKSFPAATRKELKVHMSLLVARLSQLHSRLG